jgi:hypothetical protein
MTPNEFLVKAAVFFIGFWMGWFLNSFLIKRKNKK